MNSNNKKPFLQTLIFFLVLSLWAAEGLTNISDQIIESTVPVDFDFPEDTSSGLGKFKPRSLMGRKTNLV